MKIARIVRIRNPRPRSCCETPPAVVEPEKRYVRDFVISDVESRRERWLERKHPPLFGSLTIAQERREEEETEARIKSAILGMFPDSEDSDDTAPIGPKRHKKDIKTHQRNYRNDS